MGYRGRTGIFEVLQVDQELQELMVQRADTETIRKQAAQSGTTTLRQDGLEKVRQGITTLEEVLRVT